MKNMVCHIKIRVDDRNIIDSLSDAIALNYSTKSNYRDKHDGLWCEYTHTKMTKTIVSLRKNRHGESTHATICLNPHYHHNQYRHNGNDLSVSNCIKALGEIMHELNITPAQYQNLKVFNIEFGLNLCPNTCTTKILNNTHAKGREEFKRIIKENYYLLRTGSNYAGVKMYHKGKHYGHYSDVDANALRFEVKSNQAKKITALNIYSMDNLFQAETYNRMGQEIETAFRQIIMFNPKQNLNGVAVKHKAFVRRFLNLDAWLNPKDKKASDARNRSDFYTRIKPVCSMKLDLDNLIANKILELKKQ